ncbi:helix-hairpin-helix domain-containing protein (plasmid) [Haloferacaceae archaeon DSL9]
MSILAQDALEPEFVSDEELLAAVPDHPVSSVRDIQLIYGALIDLATATDEEYGEYLTPMSAAELADTNDDSLVIVDVDVTESEPSCEGVTVKRLAEDDIPKLGLSYYASRGSGIDHSITHRTGTDVDKEKIAKYTMERLTRWTDEDAVRAYADSELPKDNLLDRLHVFAAHADDVPDPDYPDETGGLVDISGLGPSMIERMREAGLGDVEAVKAASVDELEAIKGIGSAKAEKIMAEAEAIDLKNDNKNEEDKETPSLDDKSIVNQLVALQQETHRRVSGITPAIITVRLRTEPEGEFRWPAEVPELMGAMYVQYRAKLSTKNMTDPEKRTPAVGAGTDYISNEPATLVGMPEDPLAYFTTRQREKYPGLDITEAWRVHQLSFENAARLSKSNVFIKDCDQPVLSTEVYYLPYYSGEPDAETLRGLYQTLHALVEGDGDTSPLVRAYEHAEKRGEAEDLRFYVAITSRANNTRYDVFGETVAETTLWPFELARAHRAVLDSPVFGFGGEALNVAAFYDSEEHDEEKAKKQRKRLALLDHELEAIDLANHISTGWYLRQTHPEDRTKKDGNWIVTESDRRLWALRKILAGEPIAIESLLDTYVERLRNDESEDFDTSTLVMAQFAQWCALARCGLLKTETGDETLLVPTEYMTDEPSTGGFGFEIDSDSELDTGDADNDDSAYNTNEYIELDETDEDELTDTEKSRLRSEKRRATLEHFLESSPAIRDNPERRSIFLLGAMVAQLSNYQQREERGSTLIRAYPASAITQEVAMRAHSEVVEKMNAYMQQQGYSSPMYRELYGPLMEALGQAPPETWETRPAHLQFYYGLGVAYGQSASSKLYSIDLADLYDEIECLKSERETESEIAY